MSIYAVGDIQGCYDPLAKLLDTVNFDPSTDALWCVGDLVNRGPKSLKVLRLLKSLEDSCVAVLGNHDIHLLSMIYGVRTPKASDSLTKVLSASDLPEITQWLRQRPLMVLNKTNRTILSHAGVYPWWTWREAKNLAEEVEKVFANEQTCINLLKKIYSNSPSKWSADLGKTRRYRFTINAFTRMRFCSPRGHLNLSESGYFGLRRKDRIPWYEFFNPGLEDYRVIFGHWSALGFVNEPRRLCLDTGYVWGREMTMVRLSETADDPANIKKIKKRDIFKVGQE
jgi:bis(5'-nucleosyl)-tetraphosphatase (symmetrical)